jgi:pyruvate/2-oxoglutarate dehydrogenase complex dihydrolipoamide dehydrogenase (E3) component
MIQCQMERECTADLDSKLDQRRVSDRITAYALYTDPPLGRAGMTEAEVRKAGGPALISTLAMENVSRAYEKGGDQGVHENPSGSR